MDQLKLQNIALLAEIRRAWRLTANETQRHGFKHACMVVFQTIEANAPADELWTHLPAEADLTTNSRIGDHLAVTRQLLGFPQ